MSDKHTFQVTRFAMATGLTWGLGLLFLGLIGAWFDWGTDLVDVLGDLYRGYSWTLGGAVIGGLWGFVDGFIGGAIFAWIYNRL